MCGSSGSKPLRYASKQDWSKITKQMRLIYTAPTVDAATDRLAEFADAWGEQYPAMIGAWERAWDDVMPFLAFPPEIRKLVDSTNAIESLNARFRRAKDGRVSSTHSPFTTASVSPTRPTRPTSQPDQ